MKNIISTFLLLIISFYVGAQASILTEEVVDYYKIEHDEFIISPIQTPYGLVFTNNHCDQLFIYNQSGLNLIANTKGCGRYFSVSPDRKYIGYKKITEENKQIPVLRSLENNKEQELFVNSDLCGQISFADNGALVYSSDKEIFLFQNGKVLKSFSIGEYVNMLVISPDASEIVYSNSQDQLILIDVNTSKSIQLTDGKNGYAFAKWSENSQQILFQSFNAETFICNKLTNKVFNIGKMASPVWLNDYAIVYQQVIIENQKLISSDLYLYDLVKKESVQLTSTADVFEMNPSIYDNCIII